MSLLINIIPLVVVLALLFKKQHMLFAGLIGGILAILIGGLEMSKASQMFVGGITNMLGITVPIIYAASAAMVSKAGSIESLVELARRSLKGKIGILAGIIVLIQGFATYMAGMGAGNTMVTAPLAAAAVGAIPEVIVAMAIVSAVGFTTSPASTETVLAAESVGRDVISHAAAMRPYTIAFYLLAAGLAIYGVYKRGALTKENINKENSDKNKSNGTLLKQSIPAIALLVMVVGGNTLNSLIGINLFTPATAVIFTSILTVLLTPLNIDETCEALIEGSRFILTTLFAVGMFLAFINMIGELGTFEQIAALASNVPEAIILPVAMIIAFLIAIPSGAFAAGVLTLILPTLSALGLPSEAMGFVAIATGLGTQISPVQINVAALSKGFEIDIIDVIKGNLRYILGALVLLIIIAVVVI
ncbi:hypothetical protein KQI38_11400 [Tissierella carlieri]|uniref:Citrate transporter n=1 Tax=Tissierella carlieri TaxID=689904 RepID=A0ABT1S7F6_9FIRM|nr:hypothetical protein [Tissierella carlieri]MBU5312640.1 hypothetical protein [Tissierella carlieri]MCQ4922407.1 hypothetical protein [Tissierella carlieri]